MIIFAIQDDFEVWGPTFTGFEPDQYVLNFTAQDTIAEVVEAIYQTWMRNPGNIDCLFLCGHGNSGYIVVGTAVNKFTATKFARLKGTFTANSRGIELHGCACASSTTITGEEWQMWLGLDDGFGSLRTGKGYNFLKSLAVNSGVKATAPFNTISGLRAAYSYDGISTLTVKPDGLSYFTER